MFLVVGKWSSHKAHEWSIIYVIFFVPDLTTRDDGCLKVELETEMAGRVSLSFNGVYQGCTYCGHFFCFGIVMWKMKSIFVGAKLLIMRFVELRIWQFVIQSGQERKRKKVTVVAKPSPIRATKRNARGRFNFFFLHYYHQNRIFFERAVKRHCMNTRATHTCATSNA